MCPLMEKKSAKWRAVWEITIIAWFAFVESSLRQQRKSSFENKTNFSISYLQRLGCLNHDLQVKSS